MPEPLPARRYRFGAFEADEGTGELRRHGIRLKLNAQPFQVLCLMLERPGEVLTRELLPTPAYRDAAVQSGRKYWYLVTAVDRAGNESPASAVAAVEIP